MTRTHRGTARSLGLLLAGAVALSLYTPMTSATAKVAPAGVQANACACTVTVTPASGIRGSVVTVDGEGFTPSATVTLAFLDAAHVRIPLPNALTGVRGRFHTTITVPSSAALGHGYVVANTGSLRNRAGFLVTRTCSTTAAITVSPTSGKRGSSVDVNGSGFCANTRVRVRLRDSKMDWFTLAMSVLVDGNGRFSSTGTVPSTAAIGDGYIAVHDAASDQSAKKPFTVKS
jgi:hypothetical protein